jgi:DNA-binding MarR family transcriptional regulator
MLERVMQPYFAKFGVSGPQWGVLRTLSRAEQRGEPTLRLVDLSKQLLVRPPSVTGIIDRLEKAGLVERTQSASDQRSRPVGLTRKGRELIEKVISAGHQAQYHRVMGVLSPEEQSRLGELLTRLSEHLESLSRPLESSEAN